MSMPILATKLYIPPPRAKVVHRPRLLERLNGAPACQLTLISAPAGFGKTTLVSAWLTASSWPVAWLSLDERDNDLTRFLIYLVLALQSVAPKVGDGVLAALQSPQPPPTESLLTTLLNEITTLPANFVLVLDDYHALDNPTIDQALTFVLDHLPPVLHLVMITREQPSLPLARLRARNALCEIRAPELRFTESEATEFLNDAMGLSLSAEDIAALEERTEGWIAGLQLAALSMQGDHDTSRFIHSFSGSHRFVLDYLVAEVLEQQPAGVQLFLLRTSILERLCGPLCDAVLRSPAASGQSTLEYLDRSNLFLVPLDNERRWYRYHHLFADLLRQRLQQRSLLSTGGEEGSVDEYHRRASQWYEDNGLALEAFQHAAAAHDIERAARLIEGKGIPRHFRGAVTTILAWLESLPVAELDARPMLWWRYASLSLVNGQANGVEEKLQAAEAAVKTGKEVDDKSRNLIGQIAATRAVLAVARYQVETMLSQSRRALEYLPANNLAPRATAAWTLGVAYQHQGERAAAQRAFTESIALSQACGEIFTTALATIGLADIQIAQNQLYVAAENFQHVLQLLGDPPLPVACEAHLDLAQIYYEWNDLDAAERHGQQSLHLARQFGRVIDRFVICQLFLARLKLAQGDVNGASALLAEATQSARALNFSQRLSEIAAVQVLILLRQGKPVAAAQLAGSHDLPTSRARVHLAQGEPAAALAVLEPVRRQVEAKGWEDERLKILVLQALAHDLHGDKEAAMQTVGDALTLAEVGGFIRLFVDEGPQMARLLNEAAERGIAPAYTQQLLAAFPPVQPSQPLPRQVDGPQVALIEPLSEREIEVLQQMAQGLSNQAIAAQLYLTLNTVKVHSRNIYAKLGVHNRTQAIVRARALGLLAA